ncbi:MAG: ureidoacrylate peracid hydrolase [Paracoccaceae bacterium]|jgi:ureidoacrylate peracid hydrolase
MSSFQMPQHVIDRVMEKRGRLNVFDNLDPTKTAFLVVDMQNFFVNGVQPCLDVMPNINRLAEAVRQSGGLVVWVVLTVAETEDGPSLWPIYHDNFFTEDKMKAHKKGLTRGTKGHAIHKDMDVRDEDMISEKTRFSALVQGASDLHEQLQTRGIENVLVGGTLTNMCCESTARDAMMIGYRAVMVEDCNASRNEEDHAAGLTSVYQSFSDVRSTDDVIENVLGIKSAATAAE